MTRIGSYEDSIPLYLTNNVCMYVFHQLKQSKLVIWLVVSIDDKVLILNVKSLRLDGVSRGNLTLANSYNQDWG